MAKIEITVPGERIVEDFTALVPQPTSPSTARAPDVGLVELSYVNPSILVPGPPGPPGPAGTRWYTGVGDPTITGAKLGDYYLDDVTGYIWTWNGTAWVMTGTDLSPDASELLMKIKTVDGSGSGLDADTLDGQDGAYYLDYDNLTDKPTTFPPTLPIAQSDVTNLVSDLALKAPLASPTFTGDPKAPTPAAADNDTSIATTAFVKSVVGTVNPFPEAPVDGLTYGRKNAAWSTIVGGAVVSDTAPGGPLQTGQLWYESDSGNTYIWYDDPSADTGQWVQQNVMPPSTGITQGDADARYVNVSGDTMTGALTAVGLASTTSVAATGAVTAASVAATGAITGQSINLGNETLFFARKVTAVIDFSPIGPGSQSTANVSVPGAAVIGMVAMANSNSVPASIALSAFVSAAGVVTVIAANNSAGTVDPGNATITVIVLGFT